MTSMPKYAKFLLGERLTPESLERIARDSLAEAAHSMSPLLDHTRPSTWTLTVTQDENAKEPSSTVRTRVVVGASV